MFTDMSTIDYAENVMEPGKVKYLFSVFIFIISLKNLDLSTYPMIDGMETIIASIRNLETVH